VSKNKFEQKTHTVRTVVVERAASKDKKIFEQINPIDTTHFQF
jgi:hypothetical protein